MFLVINCGSSTIKFALFQETDYSRRLSGAAKAIDTTHSKLICAEHGAPQEFDIPAQGHQAALNAIVDYIGSNIPQLNLNAVGHRVVHGGDYFQTATRIDCGVIDRIEELCPLAPLHNPAHLLGIGSLKTMFPGVPQFAVFDTAFHQTMPAKAYRYALPEEYFTKHQIRRYGAHGTSHQFVAQRAAEILGKSLGEIQLITVHLGNGCSACAIRDGKSVDTTMGFTPQEGMMMGTRSGDVDPTLHHFIASANGESLDSITKLFTNRSGLLGVSGKTNDVRELERLVQNGDEKARLALDLFCYRAAKSILSMSAALSQVDALVFTAGIGENSAFIRSRIIEHLHVLRIGIDKDANMANGRTTNGVISSPDSPAVLVIKTDEELEIARQMAALL